MTLGIVIGALAIAGLIGVGLGAFFGIAAWITSQKDWDK